MPRHPERTTDDDEPESLRPGLATRADAPAPATASTPVTVAPTVQARGLRIGGQRSAVFEHLDVHLLPQAILVVAGGRGSGKTSLLLTLGGRMRPDGGSLTVFGLLLPRHGRRVRRATGLAGFTAVSDLDDNLSVQQHVAERLILTGPWWRPVVSKKHVMTAIDAINERLATLWDEVEPGRDEGEPLETALRPRALVGDLSPLQRTVLSAALAVLGPTRLLLVDDVDALRSTADRQRAWLALLALLDQQTDSHPLSIVASCHDPSDLDRALPLSTVSADRVHLLNLTPATTSS